MSLQSLLTLTVGVALGLVIGSLIARSRSAGQIGQLTHALHSERAQAAEQIAVMNSDQARSHTVEALIAPVTQSLTALASRVDDAERARLTTTAQLSEQLRSMAQASVSLRDETGRLVLALNRSEFRGRWGEAQLKRVVEAAGLVHGVHFVEQPTLSNGDGTLRPDMIITLSNDRKIIVDAKVALDALLAPADWGADGALAPSGAAAEDNAMPFNGAAKAGRNGRLIAEDRSRRHAAGVAAHIDQLASKQYWRQFSTTPEFVVMFLPAESLLGTALQADPGLLDRAFARNIVLATPSTLVALLRTIAMGWRDEALADNARVIHELGRELHIRLQILSGHLGKLGSALDGAVASYNKTVGSWEGRVLVAARRMADLGVASEPLAPVSQIDRRARSVAGVATGGGGDDLS